MPSSPHRLFQPVVLGTLALRNRVVMAPMTRRKAPENGVPTPAMREYYERRAVFEVGLLVSEGTGVDELHAVDTPTVPRLATGPQRAAWGDIVTAVHRRGGAFAPQLWHTGPRALRPIAPSAGIAPPRGDGTVPERPIRAMGPEDFAQVLEAFRETARAVRNLGADALEIHGAHGYLLDAFLSPTGNRRRDAYGGSLENRMRFPLEVLKAVREAVGPGFPILYRFSQWPGQDPRETKFPTPEDLEPWVRALRENGADLLHVSTLDALAPGFPGRGERSLAGWTRVLSGLPVIAVGRVSVGLPMDRAYGPDWDVVTDPAPAVEAVERGEVDLLAVGRALIANPDWVPLVREGRWRELKPFHKSLLETLV